LRLSSSVGLASPLVEPFVPVVAAIASEVEDCEAEPLADWSPVVVADWLPPHRQGSDRTKSKASAYIRDRRGAKSCSCLL
jgi:hypothetical protein